MADATDMDAYAQLNTILDPGQDLELDCMSLFYPHVPDNAATVWPRSQTIDDTFESSSHRDVLIPQYIYPPPSAAYNYQLLPYPKPSIRTSEQIVACLTSRDAHLKDAWTQRCTYADSQTIAPAQTILQHAQGQGASHPQTGNPSRLVPAGYARQFDVPHITQPVPANQNIAHLQPPSEPLEPITPTSDPCRDGSTPYIPGHAAGRENEVQRLANALTAIAEGSGFVCDGCGKHCSTKSSLSHHKITHNKGRAHRHKCKKCDTGFRYPKDLKRHNDAKHSDIRHACADCQKVYKRKDHLNRHLVSRGHVASSEEASVLSTSTPATQQVTSYQISPGGYQGGNNQTTYSPSEYDGFPRLVADSGATFEPLHAQKTRLYSSLLEVPRSSFGSIASGSLDDSFTVSDVGSSFSSENYLHG